MRWILLFLLFFIVEERKTKKDDTNDKQWHQSQNKVYFTLKPMLFTNTLKYYL